MQLTAVRFQRIIVCCIHVLPLTWCQHCHAVVLILRATGLVLWAMLQSNYVRYMKWVER